MKFPGLIASMVLAFAWSVPVAAAEDWNTLLKPGTHGLMRHAEAPGIGDPGNFRLDDCTTQRNLDARGRRQAEAAGAAIRAKGVQFTAIFSSQWCRTLETARLLGLGPVKEEPLLNSFFSNAASEAAQTAGIIAKLKSLPESSQALLVTHQVNITALTGIAPRSGEIIVISVSPDDAVTVVGRIGAEALR